jgi:mannose-6-phosphate isomerase
MTDASVREPIFFVPFFEEKPWGGQKLGELYSKFPPGIHIGMSWEVSPIQYRQTFVRNGVYSGTMLMQLYKEHRELFGTDTPYMPLVVKLIDAHDTMPVKVNGGGMKNDVTQTDLLYIVDADPLSQMVVGADLKDGLELFNAIATDSVADHLYHKNVKPEEAYAVPAGTLYALGAGVLALSVTTPLAETSNLYDWEAFGQLELDKAIDSFRYDFAVEKYPSYDVGVGRRVLVENDLFLMEKFESIEGISDNTGDKFAVFTALAHGRIEHDHGTCQYRAGDSFMMPAGSGNFTIYCSDLIKVSVK